MAGEPAQPGQDKNNEKQQSDNNDKNPPIPDRVRHDSRRKRALPRCIGLY